LIEGIVNKRPEAIIEKRRITKVAQPATSTRKYNPVTNVGVTVLYGSIYCHALDQARNE
jgi:hypothetical protein